MAIMKLTAFNGGMKGKVAGTIFQSSPHGQVLRTKPMIDPLKSGGKLTHADAGRVIQAVNTISKLSTYWRQMSISERAAWSAAAINFPFKNKFGDTYTGSGYQVFMSVNAKVSNIGLDIIDNPPSAGGVVIMPPFTIAYDSTTKALNLATFAVESGCHYRVQATPPLSAGRSNRQSIYTTIAILDGTETFPVDLSSPYSIQFGFKPTTANIWFKITPVNDSNGQLGQPWEFYLQY